MQIAIVGCGYVADLYQQTLPNHPELQLTGVYDRNPETASRFSSFHSVPAYSSLEELLADEGVEIVLNLTNPESHYEVSRSCLEGGRHVYSEKPLATDLDRARELVALAKERGLQLSSAPCSVLGETAQTVWKALREGEVGPVHLVYAELDDGLIHRTNYRTWKSMSGAPWPHKDEFEVGCTIEHAGYYLTWLLAFFGPARRVTSFASVLVEDKKTDLPLDAEGPDFSVGCIEFASGEVARITCSTVAPYDHALRVIGEDGVLYLREAWDYASPVYVSKSSGRIGRMLERKLGGLYRGRKYRPVRRVDFKRPKMGHRMDFARGVAELAQAIREDRPSRLSADFGLHVTEITLALTAPHQYGTTRTLETSFEPMEPMPWAL